MVKVSSPDAAQNISKVTVHFEATTKTQKIADREDLLNRVGNVRQMVGLTRIPSTTHST